MQDLASKVRVTAFRCGAREESVGSDIVDRDFLLSGGDGFRGSDQEFLFKGDKSEVPLRSFST